MPKAKKTKIKQVAGAPTVDIVAVYADAVEEAAAEEMEVDQEVEQHGRVEDSIEDDDKEVLAEVNEVIKLARAEVAASQVRVREAETALRAEQRRAEERDKRWWAPGAELREDKENRPPPYLQVERGCTRVSDQRPQSSPRALRSPEEGGRGRVGVARAAFGPRGVGTLAHALQAVRECLKCASRNRFRVYVSACA